MLAVTMKQMQNLYIIRVLSQLSTSSLDFVTRYTQDEIFGNILSSTDENGIVTNNSYDAFAYTYNCPSALCLFQAYAKDLGFKFKLPNVYTLKKYEGQAFMMWRS